MKKLKLISLTLVLNLTSLSYSASHNTQEKKELLTADLTENAGAAGSATGGSESTPLAKHLSFLQTHLYDLRSNKISELNFIGKKIGDDGARAIAEVLTHNTSLKKLCISYNLIGIGDNGANYLSKALMHNTSLIRLEIAYNEIGDKGTQSLAEALMKNTSLTILNLMFNTIGDPGAHMLAEVLKSNTHLQSLCLDHNKIGDQGATGLAEALKITSSLKLLSLQNNLIGDNGIMTLVEALKDNTSINAFLWQGNSTSDPNIFGTVQKVVCPKGLKDRKWSKLQSLHVTIVELNGDRYSVTFQGLPLKDLHKIDVKALARRQNPNTDLAQGNWTPYWDALDDREFTLTQLKAMIEDRDDDTLFQNFVKNPELMIVWNDDEEEIEDSFAEGGAKSTQKDQ